MVGKADKNLADDDEKLAELARILAVNDKNLADGVGVVAENQVTEIGKSSDKNRKWQRVHKVRELAVSSARSLSSTCDREMGPAAVGGSMTASPPLADDSSTYSRT